MPRTTLPDQPKYRRWAQELRQQIKSGELAPGDRLPSQTEMRDKYGVGRPLVERIHALLEEEGLIVREPGLGVFVAQRQRRKKAKIERGMIGCLSVAMTSLRKHRQHGVYWSHLLTGIEEGARLAGRQLLLFDHFSPGDAWEKVDGVITTAGQQPAALPGLPCVSLLHQTTAMTSVLPDNNSGTFAATQHLLELGHTRIACLTFTDEPLSRRKVSGYEQALRRAGLRPDPKWQRSLTEPNEPSFDFMRYGEKRMTDWLGQGWHEAGLTAILCENDQTAIGVIEALRKAGLQVPRDVSVIGFDGTEISRYSQPALTTVEVPLEEIGRRGVQEILARIEDEDTAIREIMLPTQLQVRHSTAPPPVR